MSLVGKGLRSARDGKFSVDSMYSVYSFVYVYPEDLANQVHFQHEVIYIPVYKLLTV